MKYRPNKKVFNQYHDDFFNGLYVDLYDGKKTKTDLGEDDDMLAFEDSDQDFFW